MKYKISKILFIIVLPLILLSHANFSSATVLGVPEIIQEQNNWCWAGCSRAVLLYYGTNVAQCNIADWARQQNNWGNANCCTNPGGAICNQYNLLYGSNGSIQAILQNWGVNNNARGYALSKTTVSSEISAGRPFVFRWGFNPKGGHFMVGRGIDGDNVHYMDPWPGNGYSIATYNWVKSGSNHTWTHTLQLTTNVPSADVWLTKWGTPPGNPPPYKTADIWLSKTPEQGVNNTIYAKVHNSGPNNAAAVNVEFFAYYFGSGIKKWYSVGSDVVSVTNGNVINAMVSWKPKWDGHSCIKVVLTYGNDPNSGNNLAQENYDIQKGSAGGWVESQFWIYNPFTETQWFLADWQTKNMPQDPELSPYGEFQLAPNDSMNAFMGFMIPDEFELGITTSVHFTQRLRTEEIVGGVTMDFVVADGLPFIEVASPNGGEIWVVNSEQTIYWNSSESISEVKLEFSADGGTGWDIIDLSYPNEGSYPIVVFDAPSNECLVRISDARNPNIFDVSDGPFTIQHLEERAGFNIYVSSPMPDGEWARITHLHTMDTYNPCWSPDGGRIAHDALDFGPGFLAFNNIFITDVATGESYPLEGAEGGKDCSWSPDGERLVFERDGKIWIIPAWGGEASLIGENGFDPHWSPNNELIVFTFATYLFTIPASGGTPNLLTNDPAGDFEPAWSPTGDWIAFTSTRSGNADIWKIKVSEDGSPIGEPIQLTNDPARDGRPTWSPNGEEIAFNSRRSGNVDIWRMNADGEAVEQITTSHLVELDPAWSPDGEVIAFASNAAPCSPPLITAINVVGWIGNNVAVEIFIEDNPIPIDAFGFQFVYCGEMLSLVEVLRGGLTEYFGFFEATEDPPGKITIGGFDANPIPAHNAGVIAIVVLHVEQCVEGEICPLVLQELKDDLVELNICEGTFTCGIPCLLGDLNMDETITPGDALCAFKIYLNGGTPPPGECDTECSIYSADANCNGDITPGDALIIFQAYLNGLQPPLECPPKTEIALEKKLTELTLNLAAVNGVPGEEIVVPINVDNPQGLNAYGLDLGYPKELLSFIKVSPTNLTKGWQAVAGKENVPGVVTVGGFNPKPISTSKPGALATVTFKVKETAAGVGDLWLLNLTDDVAEAAVNSGGFSTIVNGVRMIGGPEVPTSYALEQNYPNPFNMETEIVYQIPEAGYVNLMIYNALGHKIRTLVSHKQSAGRYAARWDGRDEQGREITSGVYIYRLETSKFNDVKKMLLIK